MKLTTSYKTKILHFNNIFNNTLTIYRKALSFVIKVVELEWDNISSYSAYGKVNTIESCIHNTRNNIAKYDFDSNFYKFPSYLRTSVISKAIGIVSSYKSNYKNWEQHKISKPPKLQYNHNSFPVLYNKNMFEKKDGTRMKIKIFWQNDWVWLNVNVRKQDYEYIKKYKGWNNISSPTLEKKGKCWYLRFAFEENIQLRDHSPEIITAVDIGINNAAVCVAMRSDGTVLDRKFINFPKEKDQIEKQLNHIKKAQQNGANRTPRLWAFANNYNKSLTEKTAKAIFEFAVMNKSSMLVFENLSGLTGKKRGSRKQRLHLWRKQAIVDMAASKFHRVSGRYCTVNAWNTSNLAYDGSGRVTRDKDNFSMCTFSTGKRYNSDLNAAYNIGARYWLRYADERRPDLTAHLPTSTQRTLSDLHNFFTKYKKS